MIMLPKVLNLNTVLLDTLVDTSVNWTALSDGWSAEGILLGWGVMAAQKLDGPIVQYWGTPARGVMVPCIPFSGRGVSGSPLSLYHRMLPELKGNQSCTKRSFA